jgi:RNA polymerase sigma factor (sigma-70 family)
MALGLDSLLAFVHKVTPNDRGDDGQLLCRFAAGDELAFAALVHRYAPLVWGVCHRALPRRHDAEDAFQATFLVLSQKARSLGRSGPLGPWLHTVARRTATKARVRAVRLAGRERDLSVAPAYQPEEPIDDLRRLIDEEVGRLPEKYRLPIVLCYLEGLTNEQAADRLGCPTGTVLSRLSRGRDQLRQRLRRRGVEAPMLLPALVVPAGLVEAVGSARTGGVTESVMALAQGVMTEMSLKKLQAVMIALLSLAVLGGGAGLWASRSAAPREGSSGEVRAAGPQVEKKSNKSQEKKKDEKKEKTRDIPPLRDSEIPLLLSRTIDFAGWEGEMQLAEALEHLSQLLRVQILFNVAAFKDQSLDELRITRIGSVLPRLKASLRTVLNETLARVSSKGALTFLVRKDYIEITTTAAARAELGVAGQDGDPLPPLVFDEFHKEPLDSALRRLAESADVNVIVDARVEEKATVKVTASFRNLPVATAVELLSDMAGLAVVKRGNALYVTSPENAERLNKLKR